MSDSVELNPVVRRLRMCTALGCLNLGIENSKCVKHRATKPVALPDDRRAEPKIDSIFAESLEDFAGFTDISQVVEEMFAQPNDWLPDPPQYPHWTDQVMADSMVQCLKVLEDMGYTVTLQHKDMPKPVYYSYKDHKPSDWCRISFVAPPSQPPAEPKDGQVRMLKDGQAVWADAPSGFVKHDAGKTRFSLVPPEARLEVAKVFTHGAKKYPPHNYRKGTEWSRYMDALHRHMNDFELGQNVDEESGLLTLAHVAACAMILISLQKLGRGTDDRA